MPENRLKLLRDRAGLTLQALAQAVGTNAAQISKLEKGERRLTIDWMIRIGAVLGVDPAELLPLPEPTAEDASTLLKGGEARLASEDLRLRAGTNDLIPVRSAARGGNEQEMFLRDGPIDFIARPRSLGHVQDAYAIYMVGDSMFPRFRQGQLLHVNPFKPPQPGAGVVITRQDDAVLIKEFVKRGDSTLSVKQYNPPADLDYPLQDIRDIHTVVGLEEP